MAELTMQEEGSTPATPGTNKWTAYFKSDGLYIVDDTGAVTGPFKDKTYNDTLYEAIDSWRTSVSTWSYSSADAPTFVISINSDMTAKLQVGMRVKLTQTTVKYFIITAVGSYSGGNTLVTVYGGTDYTLANASITSPFYSSAKAPFGFPLDPTKWTVTLSDTSNRSQATPTSTTWYNLGSLSISVPIGIWNPFIKLTFDGVSSGAIGLSIFFTLSTANNSESNAEYTLHASESASAAETFRQAFSLAGQPLIAAAKTTYYLNGKSNAVTLSSIAFRGDLSATNVRLVCAYL